MSQRLAGGSLAADIRMPLTWSVAALLHLVFHARHLDGFAVGDAIALVATLATVLALPVLAIVLSLRERIPAGA